MTPAGLFRKLSFQALTLSLFKHSKSNSIFGQSAISVDASVANSHVWVDALFTTWRSSLSHRMSTEPTAVTSDFRFQLFCETFETWPFVLRNYYLTESEFRFVASYVEMDTLCRLPSHDMFSHSKSKRERVERSSWKAEPSSFSRSSIVRILYPLTALGKP